MHGRPSPIKAAGNQLVKPGVSSPDSAAGRYAGQPTSAQTVRKRLSWGHDKALKNGPTLDNTSNEVGNSITTRGGDRLAPAFDPSCPRRRSHDPAGACPDRRHARFDRADALSRSVCLYAGQTRHATGSMTGLPQFVASMSRRSGRDRHNRYNPKNASRFESPVVKIRSQFAQEGAREKGSTPADGARPCLALRSACARHVPTVPPWRQVARSRKRCARHGSAVMVPWFLRGN